MDSEESESDQDQVTSSRTESSNQLDMKLKHSKCEFTPILVCNFIRAKHFFFKLKSIFVNTATIALHWYFCVYEIEKLIVSYSFINE